MPYIKDEELNTIAFAETDGISLNIFLTGCSIRCPECHNKELWDTESGIYVTPEDLYEKVKRYEDFVDNICILGGEPLDQEKELLLFLNILNREGFKKDIWLYTGYNEYKIKKEILELCNKIKCGCYDDRKKERIVQGNGVYLATNNQYFIDGLRNNFVFGGN